MKEKERLQQCIERIVNGTASENDIRFYDHWYETMPEASFDERSFEQIRPVLLQRIHQQIQPVYKIPKRKSFLRIAVAAIFLLALGVGIYLYNMQKSSTEEPHHTAQINIPAGGNKATLTLDNGQAIVLSEEKEGIIWGEDEPRYKDGTSIEKEVVDRSLSATQYATLATPNGGQYQVVLSDGTKVWLNAGSSIRYPTHFGNEERLVELTGEAYFEVAPNKRQPFKVQTRGQEVEVLGTHFNVAAYPDDPATKTTLLEGSVRVMADSDRPLPTLRLMPGEQSILSSTDFRKEQVDTRIAVAWKNGDFIFDDDIQTIMRQVARWYNVEVVYQGAIPKEEFGGKVSRSKSIRDILKVLETTGKVHFKIEEAKPGQTERRVIVMP